LLSPLRLWPGVAVVVLQLAALYVPDLIDPASPLKFFGLIGSATLGPLLLAVWWLFFSRARWSDRVGGVALLVGAFATAYALAHPSARLVLQAPGIAWLCTAFVASLFLRRRSVTVAAILVASLGWTLVRTNGVTGTLRFDFAWRWSATAEERFLASSGEAPVAEPADLDVALDETVAWPGFRGAARDGVARGVSFDPDWSAHPPRELWRRPVGPGWSSFVLAGGELCTQEQRDEDEAVACYDAATGEPLWLHAYRARFWESLGGAGPRATPTYHRGRLYTLGATGVLSCLDAATGAAVWSRDIKNDTDAAIPDWGFAASPLVVDDLVVVHAPGAVPGKAVAAYDLADGTPRWSGAAPGQSYASPHLATLAGTRQIVMVTGAGAFALDPATGAALWTHSWPLPGGSRVVQPTILDGGAGLLIGTTFGVGTRRLDLAVDAAGGWTATERWTTTGLKPYYNDMVLHRGTVYGFDGNILAAVDVESGERRWKGGRYGNGQLLLLPDMDLLLVVSEQGDLALVRASPEHFEEVARMPALHGKTWNHPVVADGVVYLRNGEEAAAWRLP